MSYLPYNILVAWKTPEDTSDIETIEIYKGSALRSCERIINSTDPIYVTNRIANGTYIDQLNQVGEFKYVAIARNQVSHTECSLQTFKVYPDSDGDGIPDDEDLYPYDFDNDGIPDISDSDFGLNYLKLDTDGDGITNDFDPDDDNDGLLDGDDPFPLFYNRQLIIKHGDGSSAFTGIYPNGAEVQLRAVGNNTDNLEFKYWDGDQVTDSLDEKSTIIMDGDKTITGHFGLVTFDLTLNAIDKDSLQDPGNLNFIGAGPYERNDLVEFEADLGDSCLQFVEWRGAAVLDKFSYKTKVRMSEDFSITAVVEVPEYQVQVKSIGYGDARDGQVLFDQNYKCGDIATFTIPDPGNSYSIESIDDSNGKIIDGGTYSFEVTENRIDLLARVLINNVPPIANKDPRAVGKKGGFVVIDVKSNDFDPDGDPLTIIITQNPLHGTATVTDVNGNPNPNGSHIKYQHNDSFDMVDEFKYKVNDGLSDSNETSVEIGVGVSRGDKVSFSARQGLYDIPLIVGTDPVKVVCHFDAYSVPDRFQIYFNPDGVTTPGDPAHLVADSLYVGDRLTSSNSPHGVGTFTVTRFLYTGGGGDAVNGQFQTQPDVTLTNTSADSAVKNFGKRSDASPNGPGQIGVENRTIVNEHKAIMQNLHKAYGNVAISLDKGQTAGFIAFIRVEAVTSTTGWNLYEIEFF
jgi:hypothetical protein